METKSGDRQLTQQAGEKLYPSAADLKQRDIELKSKFQEYLKNMNYRIRAVELAAQFPSAADPMRLAREIYKFLSDTEV